MKHQFYLPSSDKDRAVWLQNFSTKLAVYAVLLSIAPGTLTSVHNDSEFYSQLVLFIKQIKDYLKNLISFKKVLSTGVSAGVIDVAAAPVIGMHTAVEAGIFNRIGDLVVIIKRNPNYTEAIGNDLGIIGTEINIDFSTAKPDVTLTLKNAHVYSKWGKEHADSVDIKADYDDGAGFVTVGRISPNHFLDPHLPPAGQTKIYKYTFRFVVEDEEVGLWSDPLEITVTGI